MVKGKPNHGRESGVPRVEMATWREFEDARAPGIDWEWCKVAKKEVATVGDPGRAHPHFTTGRYVHDKVDLACPWGNANNLLVVWLGCVEMAVHSNHAVPGSIWFPIVKGRTRICDRSGLQECGQIGDISPCAAIDIHLDHTVWIFGISVRTPTTGQDCEEGAADKGYVCNSQCVS
jgi:hypothetical protein